MTKPSELQKARRRALSAGIPIELWLYETASGKRYCGMCLQWLHKDQFYESRGACKACRLARQSWLDRNPESPRGLRKSAVVRFIRKVQLPDGCWIWQGGKDADGYGQFKPGDDSSTRVHRYSYALFNGPIPDGLQIDHLCRNRACVNPKHLEAVELAVNLYRGEGYCAISRKKTHCKRGHELTEENIYRNGRSRHCKLCNKIKKQLRLERLTNVNQHQGIQV